ncbi:MAG: VTT domain-containing protein [Gemmatimonadota bacterium]|nr:VTT domain-containing protein [Gemmatimonadota bacterium]
MKGRPFAGLAVVALSAAVSLACAAPAAQRATGPIADDVERALASGSSTFDHAAWDELLREGTRDGLVDYAAMAAERPKLDAYLDRIAEVDLGSLAPAELEALLINAYNALTVAVILDHPDVSSIQDIGGVWTDLTWEVGGHEVTLDNIEHNLLRPFYRDPRIHFAVNCASMSCAPLPTWAFTGAGLDEQLEERSRSFLTDPDNVALADGELRVSRYFDWYGQDFVKEDWSPRAETIPAFIALYATPEVRGAIEADPDIPIAFLDYDWSLNAVTRPPVPSAGGTAAADAAEAVRAGPGEWISERLIAFREWVSGFGPWAPVVYGIGYAALVVVLVPGGTLTVGAGFTFGLWLGTLVVFLAANLGAALAFLIGRYLLRERVQRWLAGRPTLSAVDRAVEKQGWKVVFLTRLSPVFPFNVQNYFYGLTGVSFAGYLGASLIGMLPGTLLYVYIGTAGAQVAEAAGGTASWGRTALTVVGLLATFLVVVLITRVAKRELDRATAETDETPSDALPQGAGG